MRRALTILTLLTALTMGAAAQTNITFGARAGMELTLPHSSTNLYKTGSGATVGGIVQFGLPKGFFIEPGLFFYYTSMNANYLTEFDEEYFYRGQAKFYGIRIPVNVGYNINVTDNMMLGMFTGPYMNINLSAKQDYDPNFSAPEHVPSGNTNLFSHGWHRVDAGWNFGLSVTFAEHYYIGITTGVSFTPLASFGNRDKKIRVHRNLIALSLGYNF